MPSESAAMPMRPASRVRMKLTNPCPSWPSRFSAGTSTSSMISSAVSEARQPSLSSFLPARNPFIAGSDGVVADAEVASPSSRSEVSLVRMKELIPLVPCDGSVTAVTMKISPTLPCVMNRLVPLSTIVVAVAHGGRAGAAGVGAGVGLGEAEAAEHAAAGEQRHVALLLLVGAEVDDGRGAERGVRRDGEAGARRRPWPAPRWRSCS